MSQPSPEEWEAYRQLQQQGYKVDYTPEQFYQLKAQGQLQYFRTYEDYLAWVKSSPATQPGGWQPPPRLPEKPTVEDVKRALSEAKSTEHVQAVVEQAKKAGIPIEMSPAYYSKEGVGKVVVAFGDVQSGKIVEMGFAFKGAGDQNILAKASQEVDISKEIEKAQQEGFQNIQLAIEKTFMACKPEDALRISLVGEKPPPPPPPPPEPPKDAFAVAKQLIETPVMPGKPVDAAALEFQQWFWKHAPQLAQRYHVKESGPIGTPEAEEILRRMVEAGELKLEGGVLKVEFKREEGEEEFKPPSPLEGVLTALWRGFSGFAGPLAQLGTQLSGTRGLGRTAMEEVVAKTGIGFGRQAAIIAMYSAPREKLEEWKRLTREHAGQILAEAAATGAGIFAGLIESAAEWSYVLGPAIGKVAAKGAELHEKALEEYAKAVNAENLAGMIKWRTVETFTIPLRGLNWALEKASLVFQEKRVYAPEKVDLLTVQYKDIAGAAWEFEKAMRDITEKWVMGSPAPRITSLEAPFYKVPVGFKEHGAMMKFGELPFSLQPSLVRLGGEGLDIAGVFTREGGGFILKGFPESPLPFASKKTLQVIFPWEKAAETASSIFSTGGGAAAGGGGGAGLLSTLKLSLGGGGVPGVTLKTVASVKPVPLAVPAIPQTAPKVEQKLESKNIALPEIKLEERAKGSASPFATTIPLPKLALPEIPGEKAKPPAAPVLSVPLPEPKLEPPKSTPLPGVVEVAKEAPLAAPSLALPPAEAQRVGEKAAAALSVLTVPRLAQTLAPPSPTPPSQAGGGEKGKLPGLPYFSPPPASVIYRAPEWRLGKYWRVDWFAEGLKLDFRLGKLARSLAPKTVKVKQVDWLKPLKPKPKAKPKPRRKASSERSTRKAAKRRKAKRKVKAA